MTRPKFIQLSPDAYDTMARASMQTPERETGGFLLGHREGGVIVVVHAVHVPSLDATRTHYVREEVEAHRQLEEFRNAHPVDEVDGYIGEWHSHTANVGPSSIDRSTMVGIAKEISGPLALIVWVPGHPRPFHGHAIHRSIFGTKIPEVVVRMPSPTLPLLEPLLDRPHRPRGPIFISYRQNDGYPYADRLERLLRAAGLVPWRDRTDLGAGTTIDRIEHAIQDGLSGAILIVTPDILNSPVVRERELPRLLQLNALEGFHLSVANRVAQDADPSKCDYSAPDRLLMLLPDKPLAAVKQSNILCESGFVEIIRDKLAERSTLVRRELANSERPVVVNVQTRFDVSVADAELDADFVVRTERGTDGRVPSRVGLLALQTALPLLADAISKTGSHYVLLEGGAHLSIAIAIGGALPTTRLRRLEVVGSDGAIWGANPQPGAATRTITVQDVEVTTPSEDGDVAIFVSLTDGADLAAFTGLVERLDGQLASAHHISPKSPGDLDPDEASALSEAVAKAIRALAAAGNGRRKVHLAFLGPYPMAVLLGRRVNTLTCVLYEWQQFDDAARQYEPAFTLQPGTGERLISDVQLKN